MMERAEALRFEVQVCRALHWTWLELQAQPASVVAAGVHMLLDEAAEREHARG